MQKNLMKNKDINSEELQEFIKYNKAMFEYEKRFDSLSDSKSTKEEKGYLVYNDDFIELKKNLNYEYNKYYLNRNQENRIHFPFKYEQIKKLEPIEIKSVNYIKDLIINLNCVLVTKELFDLIAIKNKTSISFLVDKDYLTLILNFRDKLQLKHQKFVLNIFSFPKDEPDLGVVDAIYNSILKYFDYENYMINELKNNNKKSGHGHLVTKKWIDEWKKYTNYESIKDKYFFQNNNIAKNIYSIYKEIIDYKEKNKYTTISETEIIIVKDKDELTSMLQQESLGFVDSQFIQVCPYFKEKRSYNYLLTYYMSNGILEIFRGKDAISFKCNDNIISFDNIIGKEDEANDDLKQLIKIYFFQKHLIEDNNKYYKRNIITKDIILINKNKIQNYKDSFDYEDLLTKLDKIILTIPELKKYNNKNIDYENLNENVLDKIISELFTKYKYIIKKDNQNISKYNKISQFDIKKVKKKSKDIEYIDNFEIINKDISDYFITHKIVDKKEIIEGQIIIEKQSICLIFNYNNNNFYEIGYLQNNNDFIAEYIIKQNLTGNKNEIKDDIINILKSKGIQPLFDSNFEDGSAIWDSNNVLGHFYHITEKEIEKSGINNEEDEINDSEFVKNIISFIILVHLFNKEIKENITKKYYTKKQVINCYILNKTLFSELKKFINFDEISAFFSKSIKSFGLYDSAIQKIKSENKGYYNNLILNNQKKIKEFLGKNAYKEIKYKEIKLNETIVYYPTNFEIIREDAYACILNVLKKTNYKPELGIIVHPGRLYLKFEKQQNEKNLEQIIFGYILNNQNEDEMNYELKNILFYHDENKRNNDFDRITNERKFINIDKDSLIIDKYNNEIGKCYSLNNLLKNEEENNINENEDIDYTKAKKYISYSVTLYNEYSKIIEDYNNIDIPGEEINNDYYLINQNLLRELEKIIHFDDLQGKMEKLNIKGKPYDSSEEMVEDLFNEIKNDNKLLGELNSIDDKMLKKLDNREIYEIKRDTKKINYLSYMYFQNCQIITKETYELLYKIDKTFNKFIKYKSVYCLFSQKKVFLFIDNKIINVGSLDNNCIFIPELLIYSEKKTFEILTGVLNLIKLEGYKCLEQNIEKGEISYTENDSDISCTAKICNLNEDKNYTSVENKPYNKKIVNYKKQTSRNISEELKKLIIIWLSQENTEKNYWRNKHSSEEVFLLNKKWIDQFDAKNNNDLYNKIWDIYSQKYKSYTLDEIISKIDESILENLENEIKSKKINSDLSVAPINLKLLNDKKIKIYDEFILLNKETLLYYDKNIKMNFNEQNISYAKINNDDIIIINENSQNLILIGNYIDEQYFFNIKYILDYEEMKLMKEDIEFIFKKIQDIKKFIEQNTVFDYHNNNDDVSPIFDDDNSIGTCYKYSNYKSDFSSNIDYSQIIKNQNLISSIALAYNYQKINNYICDINRIYEPKIYLLSLGSMNQIKDENNYEKLIEFIKNSNLDIFILEKKGNFQKNLLEIIKKTDYNQLYNILQTEQNIINIENEYTDSIEQLNIDSIDYIDMNNQNKKIMIYNKFEIVCEESMNKLINSDFIKKIKNNYFPCIFVAGKMIINFPNKTLGYKEYISIIGELNEQNLFMMEYILIYYNEINRKSHLDKIKKSLDEFLQNFNFVNNSNIITDKYKNIGIIIKYNTEKGPEIPPSPPKGNSIREEFNEAPLIGLQNIGATCYMNATLQCFNHIEKFVNFFKYKPQPQSIFNTNNSTLTYSFKLLIDKLWPNNFEANNKPYTYYAPNDFKTKISSMNSLFEGIAANDAKDLVNFIIMTLHEELNNAEKSNAIDENDLMIDQTNKMLVFNNFMENFIKKNKSIISDLFYASNCSDTECSNCHVHLYNYQIYFFLVFPLEEVRKFKYGQLNQNMNNNMNNNMNMNMMMNNNMNMNNMNMNNMNMNNNMMMNNNMNMNFINFMGNNNFMLMNNNFFMPNNINNINSINSMNNMNNMNNNQQQSEVGIFDCFDYEAKQNVMTGQNAMYCNQCKITCDSYMRTNLVTGPEIFILLLNRGKGIEFDIKLNFTEYLDLSNYIEYKNTGYYYKLIGVITHIGESGMGGHFIAYCRDPITEKWHKYNDAIVTDVVNFQKDVIDFAMPYLLFYQKVK